MMFYSDESRKIQKRLIKKSSRIRCMKVCQFVDIASVLTQFSISQFQNQLNSRDKVKFIEQISRELFN